MTHPFLSGHCLRLLSSLTWKIPGAYSSCLSWRHWLSRWCPYAGWWLPMFPPVFVSSCRWHNPTQWVLPLFFPLLRLSVRLLPSRWCESLSHPIKTAHSRSCSSVGRMWDCLSVPVHSSGLLLIPSIGAVWHSSWSKGRTSSDSHSTVSGSIWAVCRHICLAASETCVPWGWCRSGHTSHRLQDCRRLSMYSLAIPGHRFSFLWQTGACFDLPLPVFRRGGCTCHCCCQDQGI